VTSKPNPKDNAEIERMVEAQARGERVSGVVTDKSTPKNAELDTRTSKIVFMAEAQDDMSADASADSAADASDDALADASDDAV
jgi:hypothetical protein